MRRKLIGLAAYIVVATGLWLIKPVYGALFVWPTLGAAAAVLLIMVPIWYNRMRQLERQNAGPLTVSAKAVASLLHEFPHWSEVLAAAEKAGLLMAFCLKDRAVWYRVALVSDQLVEYGLIEVRNSLADECLLKLLRFFQHFPELNVHDIGQLDPDKLKRFGLSMGMRAGQEDAEINFRLAPGMTSVIRLKNRAERQCLASLVKGFRQLHQPAVTA